MSGNSCPLCRAPVLPRELYPVKFSDAEHTKLYVRGREEGRKGREKRRGESRGEIGGGVEKENQ